MKASEQEIEEGKERDKDAISDGWAYSKEQVLRLLAEKDAEIKRLKTEQTQRQRRILEIKDAEIARLQAEVEKAELKWQAGGFYAQGLKESDEAWRKKVQGLAAWFEGHNEPSLAEKVKTLLED